MTDTIFASYLRAGGATFAAKLCTALAVFAEIYVLTSVLGKAGYGGFIYGYTIVTMIGVIFGNPAKSAILYRLSAEQAPLQSPFMKVMTGYVMVTGLFVTVILSIAGGESWISLLAFLGAMEMVRVTLCAGLQASHNVPAAILYNNLVPALCRFAGLLFIIFVPGVQAGFVAGVYSMVFAIPVLAVMLKYKIFPRLTGYRPPRADIIYIGKMILTQTIHQNGRFLDLVLVGTIGTVTMTADYAVALKFAVLLLTGKQLTEGLLTPRMALAAFEPEYNAARTFAFALALGGIVLFSLCGLSILSLMGDYTDSYGLFFVIAAAMIARVLTGSSAEFLAMRGRAGLILAAGIYSLAGGGVCALVFIPAYGTIGAACAAFAAAAISNIVLGLAAWHTEQFPVTPKTDFAFGMISISLCLLGGFGYIPAFYTGTGIAVILAFYLYNRRNIILPLVPAKESLS